MDPLSSPANPSLASSSTPDALRLRCPACEGGLNLRREHLAKTGKCTHCGVLIAAVERDGAVRVEIREPSVVQAPAAPPAPEATIHSPAAHMAPPTNLLPASAPRAASRALAVFPPTREEDDLFGSSFSPDPILTPDQAPATPPFQSLSGFPLPKSMLFDDGDDTGSLSPSAAPGAASASHASLFPYENAAAKPAPRGDHDSLAASLFREKAIKDSILAASPAPATDGTEQPRRDCAERVILDGDGRPLPPMLKGEEEEFAKAFFELERKQTESRFLVKLKKKLVRMLVAACVLGIAGTVAMLVVPKETLAVWKTGVAEWLEPGTAVLDFLPEGIRPDWLTRSDYGIDAVDENGNPVKLNAMEGLEKLKGDIGNMRGASEAGLKELDNY